MLPMATLLAARWTEPAQNLASSDTEFCTTVEQPWKRAVGQLLQNGNHARVGGAECGCRAALRIANCLPGSF
jgi:hypothetical protein